MNQEEEDYYPPTQQPYQHQIMIYQANGLVGHRLVECFRNDHLIEVNPNIIIGTINPQLEYRNQLDLDHIIHTNNQLLLNSAIASSDIIIFSLNQQNTQDLEHLLKFLKSWKGENNKKIIVISSIFAWKPRANPKIIRKEDYPTRIAINSTIKQLQNLCLGLHNLNPSVTGCVISSGLVYGMGEDALFYQFKQALEQKEALKIYGRGINQIPTIHVDDLTQLAFDMAFSTSDDFQFGVDYSQVSQRDIVDAIAKTIGNGQIAEVPIEDGFLEENFDIFSANITIDQGSLPVMTNWKCKSGLINNMGLVVGQFNASRGLRPNKILIHGTPASGKSKLAQILSKNYGLPILSIKQLIEDIKNQESEFANQIKGVLEELKAAKVEEERKAYEELKKKKKGKGMDEFDPSKVVPRLQEKDVCKILRRRINMADCLNKGYIIDGVIKSYTACQAVFYDENNQPSENILPNSIFSIEATEEQTKERIKKLPPEVTQGTHWNQQQTNRRFNLYKQQNQPKKWSTFFENLVEIKKVPFDYTEPKEFIEFIERNGPLGFKVKPVDEENKEQVPQKQKVEDEKPGELTKEEDQEQRQFQQDGFDLDKLTENETKILNQKSRPIRQYLIDNVIPQITEGLLQICKETPPDPIKYLITFLQTKKTRKRKGAKI